ncbi:MULTISPECIES: serine O-acetyltransferase [unclassified Flavobacterium]|jgi:serine O-acetyltransferase|uniref:serine O-acetyltransferase n=1 Tax=unclassified Flavobacterium TaxID=196869 RepID=UPI001291E52A|nr:MULTISPECIES: serine acetyltransferase [unclassified Flavobacterium]MQP52061.1 serine acetyltransferase [Flavobacterium sp. LMO9]MQP61930.1 serine acetyltransferase [Flavobacterium sp. LMO6]
MIKTKNELKKYLEQDKLALGIGKISIKGRLKNIFFPNHIYIFQKALRKAEFYSNNKRNVFSFLLFAYYFFKYKKLSIKLGFSIPMNVFGPGLAIIHYGTIVVNPRAKVGANCRIHVCTNIGESGGVEGAPQIGDNVYIGPGAKIYGNITVPNNTVIAANAAVNKSIEEPGMMIAGVPAKPIKKIDVKSIIKHI